MHGKGILRMENKLWIVFAVAAGLAWGTYVPLIFYGGNELGRSAGARLMAILCVGIAYFLIAVLFPLYVFLSGQEEWPDFKTTGLVFAGLAGVAGAVGALCVIFASKSATEAARAENLNPATYRMYIAPLIFGLAPVINTLLSSIWHPKPGEPFHFELDMPGWKLWLGILLVGAGAALVLFAKEEAESHKGPPTRRPAAVSAAPDLPQPPDEQGFRR
jgi:drug/metabolite transporter (DMT)-like permease